MRGLACLIASGLLATLLMACSSDGDPEPHAVPDGYSSYVSSRYDFAIAYPSNWSAGLDSEIEEFRAPDRDAFVALGAQPFAEGLTLERYVGVYLDSELGSEGSAPYELDGAKGLRYTIVDRCVLPSTCEGRVESSVIFIDDDGTSWLISLSAPALDRTKWEAIFDLMLSSFNRD